MFEANYMRMFPPLSDSLMLERLSPPGRRVDVVLDTDTFNEVDDQFALAYCLLSPGHVNLQAVYAAPFLNDRSSSPADGMEKSYQEILNVLGLMGMKDSVPVFKGSETFLDVPEKPVRSPAALDLVDRAMKRKGSDPLYVLAIGCPVNIASALLIEPAIRENIVLVWLGGHPVHWRDAWEFNCQQDMLSSQIVYNSGVPFVQIPCKNVAEHLRTSVEELKEHLGGKGKLADYLYQIVKSYNKGMKVWSKVIWDISVVAWLIDPEWVPSEIIHAPILTDQHSYSEDNRRHLMRIATDINRDAVFGDLFPLLVNADRMNIMLRGDIDEE